MTRENGLGPTPDEITENIRKPRAEKAERVFAPTAEAGATVETRISADAADQLSNDAESFGVGPDNVNLVERMAADGKTETWEVLAANDRFVTLGSGDKRAIMSRGEAALEQRAASFGPAVAEHWDKVLQTTEVLAAEKPKEKALKLLAKYKSDIMEMAAMSIAAESEADPEKALLQAMERVIEEYAEQQEHSAFKNLDRVREVNERMMHVRFGDLDSEDADDRYNKDTDYAIADSDVTGAIKPHFEGTGVVPDMKKVALAEANSQHKELIEGKSDVIVTGIESSPELVSVGKGEVRTIDALNVAMADGIVWSADTLRQQLTEMRRAAAMEEVTEGNPLVKNITMLEMQQRQHAFMAELATKDAQRAESMGIVQTMLAEIAAQKPSERKPGRPVDVGRLMGELSHKNRDLAKMDRSDPDWQEMDADAWALEKKILTATGKQKELRPEKFSNVYAMFAKDLDNGVITGEQAMTDLEELTMTPNLSAREKEGVRLLLTKIDNLAIVEEIVEPIEPLIADDAKIRGKKLRMGPAVVTKPLGKLKKNEPGVPDHDFGKAFDVSTKKRQKFMPGVSEPIIGGDLQDEFMATGDRNEYSARPEARLNEKGRAESYTESFVNVANAFGGPEQFIELFNELRQNGLIDLTLEDVSKVPMPSFFRRVIPGRKSTERYIDQIAAAAKKLNERQGIRMTDTFAGKKGGRGKI